MIEGMIQDLQVGAQDLQVEVQDLQAEVQDIQAVQELFTSSNRGWIFGWNTKGTRRWFIGW